MLGINEAPFTLIYI